MRGGRKRGVDLTAADVKRSGYGARAPFAEVDLNEPDFASRLGVERFDLVTAVEVTVPGPRHSAFKAAGAKPLTLAGRQTYIAAHIKNTLDAAAINVRKPKPSNKPTPKEEAADRQPPAKPVG